MKYKILLACLFLSSCSTSSEIQTKMEPCGKVLDFSVPPTAFNDSRITQIKTEKCLIIVHGYPTLPTDKDTYLITISDGRQYLSWKDQGRNIESPRVF